MTQTELRSLTAHSSNAVLGKEYQLICDGMARVEWPSQPFDPTPYSAAAIERLINHWKFRLVAEHRSSTIFTELAVQLFDANAPLDTQAIMLRMAQDELRHTETCAKALTAFGASTEGVELAPPSTGLARHPGCSLKARALRNVIYTTCMSELVACARFVSIIEDTTDPFIRALLRILLSDERLHGQFGFLYLEDCAEWLASDPTERASLEKFLRLGFATLERDLAGPLPAHQPLPDPEDLALGMGSSAAARQVFYDTMEHAVVPGLARFGIDAQTSWKERSLIPPS